MASADDDKVFRLLCHLAWLRNYSQAHEKRWTLKWARRVYNSAVHLQFRFVYPHQPQDRVLGADQPLLAEDIERVVSLSADALRPIRDHAPAAPAEDALDVAEATSICDALGEMLDAASKAGWGGAYTPKRHAECDRTVNPLHLLNTWRRRTRGQRKHSEELSEKKLAPDEAMSEFCQGLATELVVRHSRLMTRIPERASEVLHQVADCFYKVDFDSLGSVDSGQRLQTLAAHLLRRNHNVGG